MSTNEVSMLPKMIDVTLDGEQLQMLIDALDILSPDSDEACETRAGLLEYLKEKKARLVRLSPPGF